MGHAGVQPPRLAVLPPPALARRPAHQLAAFHTDHVPEGYRLHPRYDGSRSRSNRDGGWLRFRFDDMQNLAKKNLTRFGLDARVDFKLRDIGEGFDETDVDSFFLDVPNPYDYIGQVRAALKPGGFLCCLIPTFNQVEKTLQSLRQTNFAFLEVCEMLLRYYKPEPTRLRPTDRMVAHTGFLLFGRKIEPGEDPRGRELNDEIEKGDN